MRSLWSAELMRLIVWIVGGIICLGLYAWFRVPDFGTYHRLVDEARHQHAQGQFDRAIKTASAALEVFSDGYDAYLVLGQGHLGAGNHQAALTAFDAAIRAQRDRSEAYFFRARVLIAMQRYLEAEGDVDRALRRSEKENNPDYLLKRGQLLRLLRREQHARADLDQVIFLQPHNGMAFYERGLTWVASNRHEEALHDFHRAATLGITEALAFLPPHPEKPSASDAIDVR